MGKKKRIIYLLIGAICILFLFPVYHANAANATGTVKNRILNVRTKPTTSSSIVCKLTQGTKVTIVSETTGDDGMKWYSVSFTYNNAAKTGYVRADLVTVSGTVSGNTTTVTATTPSFGDTEYLCVNVSSARVREQASTSSGIVATLKKGSPVKQKSSKTGADGKIWIKVSFTLNGTKTYGYIRSDLLTAMPGAVNTPANNTPAPSTTTSSAESAENGDTLYVSATAVRVREKAGTSHTVIANLLQGDKVVQKKIKIGDDGKKWTKVSFTINGTKYTGYIRTDYLEKSSSGTEVDENGDEYRYITTGVRVREKPGTSHKVVANLLEGDKVKFKKERIGDDGKEWTKITFTINGTHFEGYVRSKYVSKTKP